MIITLVNMGCHDRKTGSRNVRGVDEAYKPFISTGIRVARFVCKAELNREGEVSTVGARLIPSPRNVLVRTLETRPNL